MYDVIIRHIDHLQPYRIIWQAMQTFTLKRTAQTVDEIWLLEHSPVLTQGLAGKKEHVLDAQGIPLIHTDRGGQVTYHGPGQLMVYLLLDLQRLKLTTRALVRTIEHVVIDYLASLGVQAYGKEEAPGIYVAEAKIGSIGLRVRRNCSYHGLALNVAMDMTPFSYINPCGFKGLAVTQLKSECADITLAQTITDIIPYFLDHFGYNHCHMSTDYPAEIATHERQATI